MNILLISIVYALVAAADLYSVRKSGKGIIAFHATCLVGSFAILVLHDLGVTLYGPSQWIKSLVEILK